MPTKRFFETSPDGSCVMITDCPITVENSSASSIDMAVRGNDCINSARKGRKESKESSGENKTQEKESGFDTNVPQSSTINVTCSLAASALSPTCTAADVKIILQQHPYSILNAIKEHNRRQTNNSNKTSSPPNSPIDIVANLLSISKYNTKNEEMISLLITDPSLPSDTCCRIIFNHRKSCTSQMMDRQLRSLQRGDVIRFNRLSFCRMYGRIGINNYDDKRGPCNLLVPVEKEDGGMIGSGQKPEIGLSKSNSDPDDKNERQHAKLPTILCEFRQSWLDPEAGVPFAVLRSSCDKHNKNFVIPHQQQQNMETSQLYVNTLVQWWVQKNAPSKMRCGVDSDTQTNICKFHQHCRRRRLCDIRTLNLTSDVLVRVISCDFGVLSSQQQKQCKQKRCRTSLHEKNGSRAFVTLFDGDKCSGDGISTPCRRNNRVGSGNVDEDNMMAFHECDRFISSLEHAYKERIWILITNVVSQNDRSSGSNGDIVLAPKSETSVVFIEGEGNESSSSLLPNNVVENADSVHTRREKRESGGSTLTLTSSPSLSSPGTPHAFGDNGISPQGFVVENHKQEIQINYAGKTNKASSPNKKRKIHSVFNDIIMEGNLGTEVIILTSKLVDIFIDGVSISLFKNTDDKGWSSLLKSFVQVLDVLEGNGEVSPTSTLTQKSLEHDKNDNATNDNSSSSSSCSYRKATLRLDGLLSSSMSSSLRSLCVTSICSAVEANGDVVETLCGGISASDIWLDTHPWRLSGLVGNLLHGMIKEEIPLRWALKRSMHGTPTWSVANVMLPRLEFEK